jgi:hypothetical protein
MQTRDLPDANEESHLATGPESTIADWGRGEVLEELKELKEVFKAGFSSLHHLNSCASPARAPSRLPSHCPGLQHTLMIEFTAILLLSSSFHLT